MYNVYFEKTKSQKMSIFNLFNHVVQYMLNYIRWTHTRFILLYIQQITLFFLTLQF